MCVMNPMTFSVFKRTDRPFYFVSFKDAKERLNVEKHGFTLLLLFAVQMYNAYIAFYWLRKAGQK